MGRYSTPIKNVLIMILAENTSSGPALDAIRKLSDSLGAVVRFEKTLPQPMGAPMSRPSPTLVAYPDGTTQTVPQPGWRSVLHKNGDVPCGRPAWYLTRMVRPDEKASLDIIRLLDGSTPTPADPPVCGSCGHGVEPLTNRDLDYRPHIATADPSDRYAQLTLDDILRQSQTFSTTDDSHNAYKQQERDKEELARRARAAEAVDLPAGSVGVPVGGDPPPPPSLDVARNVVDPTRKTRPYEEFAGLIYVPDPEEPPD